MIGSVSLDVCKILQRYILVPSLVLFTPPLIHHQALSTSAMEDGQPTNGPQEAGLSLSRILDDDNIEHLEHHKSADAPADGWDEETTERVLVDGYCVECEGMLVSPSGSDAPLTHLPPRNADQPAQVYCESCTDNFCEVCFAAQHRKGSRKQHRTKLLTAGKVKKPQPPASSSNGALTNGHDDEASLLRHTFQFWV